MTKVYLRSSPDDVPRRGATSSKAGLDVPRRVAALEQGAGHRLAPSVYCAAMRVANSGAPTHTSSGGWQKVGSGGGTATWSSSWDNRPTGVSAQVDTATNKRIDIQREGIYLVTAAVGFTALTDAKLFGVAIYVDGAVAAQEQRYTAAAGTYITRISEYIRLTAGQYLELYAYQNDSASEAYLVTNEYYCRLSMALIGPPA